MKKAMTMLLTLALLMGLSIPAFAGNETLNSVGSKDIPVYVKTEDTSSTVNVYSIDITWDDMTFTYSDGTKETWNPTEHKYETTGTKGWDKTSAQITVVNHSDKGIKATVAYAETVSNTGVTFTVENGQQDLNSAYGTAVDNAPTAVFNLTISGTPSGSHENTEIGTVKVTIQ